MMQISIFEKSVFYQETKKSLNFRGFFTVYPKTNKNLLKTNRFKNIYVVV